MTFTAADLIPTDRVQLITHEEVNEICQWKAFPAHFPCMYPCHESCVRV